MRLVIITLLIFSVVCIKFLLLHVSADSLDNTNDAYSKPSKASMWSQLRETLQDKYSNLRGDIVEKKSTVGEMLANLQIPLIFDWNRYKAAFFKVYTNTREDLARQKIFFANAMKIVAHNLGFKVGKFTHFLNVNQFADITPRELEKVYMREDELNSDNPDDNDRKDNCSKEDRYRVVPSSLEEARTEQPRGCAQIPREKGLIADKIEHGGRDRSSRKMKKSCRGDNEANTSSPVKESLQEKELQLEALKHLPGASTLGNSEGESQSLEVLTQDDYTLAENQSHDAKDEEKDGRISLELQTYKQSRESENAVKRAEFSSESNKANELLNQPSDSDKDGENNNQVRIIDEKELRSFGQSNTVDSTDFKKLSNTNADANSNLNEYQVDGKSTIIEDENNQVYLDWRDSGCLFIPRNQGLCSSCYAFVGIALMEWWHCRQTGQLVPFSEQYIVDCGKHAGLFGCRGGNMPSLGRFFMDWGMEKRQNYPYFERDSSCPYEQNDWERAGYKRPIIHKFNQAHDLLKWPEILEQIGPIMVALRVPHDFVFYGGKVHKGDTCALTETGHVHLMLVIGHGKENGQDYWLMRNSFGTKWGERGYFKLSKSCNINCFYQANQAQVDFTNESSHPSETLDGINWRKIRPSEALWRGFTGKDIREIIVY